MIQITISDYAFTAEFSLKIQLTRNPVGMLNVVGRELANQLRRHFQEKDRTDVNKLNAQRREHFWLQIAQSLQSPIISGVEGSLSVSVTISDPRLAQKIFGGPIEAKNAAALTIPETAEAYGRTARVFEAETGLKLFLVHTGKGAFENAVLAAHENGQKGFTVEYLLTPKVNQDPDQTALPAMEILQNAVLRRADKFLQLELQQPGSGGAA